MDLKVDEFWTHQLSNNCRDKVFKCRDILNLPCVADIFMSCRSKLSVNSGLFVPQQSLLYRDIPPSVSPLLCHDQGSKYRKHEYIGNWI